MVEEGIKKKKKTDDERNVGPAVRIVCGKAAAVASALCAPLGSDIRSRPSVALCPNSSLRVASTHKTNYTTLKPQCLMTKCVCVGANHHIVAVLS